MTPERWSRVKALFMLVLDVPAPARSKLLASEAHGDSALITEVESLLAAHDQPNDHLDDLPENLSAQAFAVADDNARMGERIGAYRIVGLLGTGGMGHVFKAVRDDDQYRAEVAIKLMRADVSSPLSEQRFKTERQILAGLDHPHIARMLDGGTTDSGSPYVVMELVNGEPIDKYADARGLKARDRVELFLQVCAAVSYAHRHLVIHRDLKPNNILVTAEGTVKLLDFGIAKLLNVDAATACDETATQMRVMTLDYASPEQVSGETVTTVSDVYSLGVILYLLLTGQSPYGVRVNDAQRFAEILSDTTPTRPSLVRSNDRQRSREIDADLDNILLMALRKEPQYRYGSVEQFANDLRNYLAGMPVAARGNSLRYRATKFVRRRKMEIAAVTLVTVSLVGGLWIAIREAQEAERQRLVAQRHFDSVRQMANTLLFSLHDEIAPLSGSTKARETLVNTSLEYLNTLYAESGGDRALQHELAVAYRKVGDIQGNELGANTGDPKGALQSYARSVALLEPLVATQPSNHRAGIALAESYLHQARLLLATSGAAAAFPVVQKAVMLSESLTDAFADDRARLIQLSSAYAAQAHVLDYLDRTPEAMVALDKLISLCEAYAQAHPDDPQAYKSLTAAYNNAGLVVDHRSPAVEALQRPITLLSKAMAADEKLVAMQPDNLSYHWGLAETRFNLGDALYANGQYAKAIELLRQALVVTRNGDPNDLRGQSTNALVELALAKSLVKVGGYDEAAMLFERAEEFLLARARDGNTLQIEYGLALLGIRRGQMYVALASEPDRSASEQLRYWQLARESLKTGIEIFTGVGKSVALTGPDKAMMDDGVAALAQTEAALARLTRG